jgi:predicted ATPase/DNA-binding SARP family transcriptional activator
MAAPGRDDPAVGALGPVVLRDADGGTVHVGSGRQRRLLAALALHHGADLGCDALAELVWGDDQPADPDGALQTNVGRLRRLLPPAVAIRTGARTYRLDVAPDDLDVTRFATHLARAAAAPEPGRRIAEVDAALALWRGRPFADLDHPSVEPEIARLTGLRADATEQRAAALLAAGRTGEAVAAADALAIADPLCEGAVAVLMRALVAAGRPGDALRAYGRLRTELAAQLGLDPSAELRALHEQILRQEPVVQVPAQRAAAPGLPISSFVGRDDDVARAVARLAGHRVVTLCGPGGVGKTRLARHVAAAVADRYADGVVLVDLAAARPDAGTDTVGAAVASALRLSDAGPGSLLARVVEVLAVRRQLLVLDDCEHVLDAAAALVEAVAVGAPGVDLLATSREALRVDGEQVLPVAPLPPGPAAALLADRLAAAGVTLAPGEDAALVEQICTRLDGLPLALELAAARVPGIGLAGLLDALDVPLDVLRQGRRTAAPRHRSLRDVVAWSYGLLDDDQRTLFVRLGVFAGAVEPSAVAAVCGTAAALPDLVERSLVVRHDARYGMLETLRAYARERLVADPAAGGLRDRHAAWVLEMAADVHAAHCRPDEATAVRRFGDHRAEVRRSHAWLCTEGPVEDLLRLGHVCAELGYQQARVDLVHMADAALLAAGCEPDEDLADPVRQDERVALHPMLPRLLGLSAASRWQRGDVDGAERRCRRALALAERLDDPLAARDGFEVLANVMTFRGDLAAAREYGHRAAELARAAGDDATLLMALCDLTIGAAYAGEHEAAARHDRAAAELAERMGSPLARGWAAYAAGERRAEAGLADAAVFLERAVALAEEADGAFLAGVARHTLLTTAARAADPATAPARFGPLLDTWHGMGSWTQLWIAVRALAEALSRHGRHRDAAVLVGALRASPRSSVEYGADSARVRAVVQAAAAALGPELDTAMAEGAALGDTGAVALARRLAGDGTSGPARRPVPARS